MPASARMPALKPAWQPGGGADGGCGAGLRPAPPLDFGMPIFGPALELLAVAPALDVAPWNMALALEAALALAAAFASRFCAFSTHGATTVSGDRRKGLLLRVIIAVNQFLRRSYIQQQMILSVTDLSLKSKPIAHATKAWNEHDTS